MAKGDTLTEAELSELSAQRAEFPEVVEQFAGRNWSYYAVRVPVFSVLEAMRLRQEKTAEQMEKDKHRPEALWELQERGRLYRPRKLPTGEGKFYSVVEALRNRERAASENAKQETP